MVPTSRWWAPEPERRLRDDPNDPDEREGVLGVWGEVDAIFFVLGTKFVVLRGERLASAGVCATTGLAGHQALATQGHLAAPGGLTGCARGARPRGVTHASFQILPKFFRADGTVTRPGGGSDLILVPRTKCLVLGAWMGRREGAARQGGSTKELSVRVHFVRFEPARSGGSPTSKSPPPTSVSLRSTS